MEVISWGVNYKSLMPKEALNPAYRKLRLVADDVSLFRTEVQDLLDKANGSESEEYHKNLVSDFLRQTYYRPSNYINTKGRNDLVIHNGSRPDTPVGVIIEAKRPTNTAEMVRTDDLNRRAFHELLLYYMRERHGPHNNVQLRHLIITNAYEWFVFDAVEFERLFSADRKFVDRFQEFESGALSGTRTEFFYRNVAAPFLSALNAEITFTHFDLRTLAPTGPASHDPPSTSLLNVYKLLSPQHLLKTPFVNDSNQLDRGFYTELLHVMGLEETRDGNSRLIGRKPPERRQPASLIENAINQLHSLDKLARVTNPSRFGANHEERLFNVALELVLTWTNRVLFLKLLEGQLIAYNRDKAGYAFLNNAKVRDFQGLNRLFFEVLALAPSERGAEVAAEFARVPYLNSSLFELTELEHETIVVGNLDSAGRLPLSSGTVLKDDTGRTARVALPPLSYLFQFLDAYDFASDGASAIRDTGKSIISASVLGLIFEKINGYRDGSFFTPSFVTMHMCRNTLRQAVVDKFNAENGWACANFEQLYDQIEDRVEANAVINSLRICDPAVGSGHFLVSALNELIAIKADLRLLVDDQGTRLKEYQIDVINDDLVIVDEDAKVFSYRPDSRESQRVQRAIFREKQQLIEGCLFGVDINSNSVNICRLRLWIELLKHSYYRDDGQLETLPNIDINIKCGNSLISKFPTDADVGHLVRGGRAKVSDYRRAVRQYQNAASKEQKREMGAFIARFKNEFRSKIVDNDPKVRRLRKVKADLELLEGQGALFEEGAVVAAARAQKIEDLTNELGRLQSHFERAEANRVLQSAFEWRYEFPEVLRDDGVFGGFDVVIGNPPYGVSLKGEERAYVVDTLGRVPDFEIYYWFISRSRQILRDGGIVSLIIPNGILFNVHTANYRLDLLDLWKIDEALDCTAVQIFQDAVVRNVILTMTKTLGSDSVGYVNTSDAVSFEQLSRRVREQKGVGIFRSLNENWGLLFRLDDQTLELIAKLRSLPTVDSHFSASQGYIPYRLSDLVKTYGVAEGKAIKDQEKWHSATQLTDEYIEEIRGGSLSRYSYHGSGRYIRYGRHVASYVEPRFFKDRRLLVREITNPHIIAALVEGEFVNDPQIISILPKTGDRSLEFLWAVLNSKFGKFFHFNAAPKATKGLFPKILVRDINKFPIPARFDELEMEALEELVRKAHKSAADNDGTLYAVEKDIDDAVMAMFGLSAREVALIDAALNANSTNPVDSVAITDCASDG